jgi:hypothetical protein
MKKLLLLAVLAVTAVSAMAQGRVTFRNGASTDYYIYTNTATRSLDAVATSNRLASGTSAYRIGLYASPTTGAAAGSLTLIGLATNSAALPGRFLGPAPYAITAPGYTAGQAITFQIRAWSFAGGLSYEEALLAAQISPLDIAFGVSALGTTTPTPAPSPAGELWGTTPGQLTSGFEVRPVPEPSSIALGLLGLGAIALFRRKK